jgi:hypothetical protein
LSLIPEKITREENRSACGHSLVDKGGDDLGVQISISVILNNVIINQALARRRKGKTGRRVKRGSSLRDLRFYRIPRELSNLDPQVMLEGNLDALLQG